MASGHPGVPVVPFARSKQVSGQRFTEDQAVCAAASRRLSSERAGPAAARVCLGMRWLERPDAWLLGFQLAHTSGFALPGKTVESSKQAGRQAGRVAGPPRHRLPRSALPSPQGVHGDDGFGCGETN